ncbi:MAG TPA: SAM-dependent chlorinase/fluorinase [Kofleriaceae bacterium]|nr:SAM-dependent chlorinase/fluorinase [Kofleriaceae bacterium]
MPIITLTTDFGTSDGYVGAMKGVLAARAGAAATIIDLAHDVPRHDIAHAAWIVATACTRFPAGTIHVVVVDPGVGGARRGVIVHAEGMWFVGPDNGVFAHLAPRRGRALLVPVDAAPTFHGRDVFAPAAAALAIDELELAQLPWIDLAGTLPWGARPSGEGRVVHVDHYGNLVTDLPRVEAGAAIAIAGRRLTVTRTYEDVARGELVAYVGSAGTIEIAVREGRADRVLDAPRGTRVVPVAEEGGFR